VFSYWHCGHFIPGSVEGASSTVKSLSSVGLSSVVKTPGAIRRALVGLGPKAEGRVFKTRYIKTAYNNAVAAAKLDDVNFHTLRHTFASWAAMRGVSLKELQELLGHASLTMTMRYAHLAPERLRTAVTRLEGLTSQPASDSAQASAQEPVEPVEASQKSS